MLAGVTQAAPVTLMTRTDATNLVNFRKQFGEAATGTDRIAPTYTDLIVKLAAVTLRRHPLLQAQWRDGGLFVPNRIDIAIAIDTDTGLLAPVLRDVDQSTSQQIAAQSRELIAHARASHREARQLSECVGISLEAQCLESVRQGGDLLGHPHPLIGPTGVGQEDDGVHRERKAFHMLLHLAKRRMVPL
jgi:hypothetical protein